MKVLVDTNVFLEILLAQEAAEESKRFLKESDTYSFFTTDFSLHSIGIIMFRESQHESFLKFVEDMIISGYVKVVHVKKESLSKVAKAAVDFKLDFDDAYQYSAAKEMNLDLVSYDDDFTRTDRGRKTPGELLGGT